MSNFRDLDVWQKAHMLAVDVNALRFFSHAPIGVPNQLKRATFAIAANIAEGAGQSSKRFIYHLNIAINSAREAESHLLLLGQVRALRNADAHQLIERLIEIRRMLYGLKRAIERKAIGGN